MDSMSVVSAASASTRGGGFRDCEDDDDESSLAPGLARRPSTNKLRNANANVRDNESSGMHFVPGVGNVNAGAHAHARARANVNASTSTSTSESSSSSHRSLRLLSQTHFSDSNNNDNDDAGENADQLALAPLEEGEEGMEISISSEENVKNNKQKHKDKKSTTPKGSTNRRGPPNSVSLDAVACGVFVDDGDDVVGDANGNGIDNGAVPMPPATSTATPGPTTGKDNAVASDTMSTTNSIEQMGKKLNLDPAILLQTIAEQAMVMGRYAAGKDNDNINTTANNTNVNVNPNDDILVDNDDHRHVTNRNNPNNNHEPSPETQVPSPVPNNTRASQPLDMETYSAILEAIRQEDEEQERLRQLEGRQSTRRIMEYHAEGGDGGRTAPPPTTTTRAIAPAIVSNAAPAAGTTTTAPAPTEGADVPDIQTYVAMVEAMTGEASDKQNKNGNRNADNTNNNNNNNNAGDDNENVTAAIAPAPAIDHATNLKLLQEEQDRQEQIEKDAAYAAMLAGVPPPSSTSSSRRHQHGARGLPRPPPAVHTTSEGLAGSVAPSRQSGQDPPGDIPDTIVVGGDSNDVDRTEIPSFVRVASYHGNPTNNAGGGSSSSMVGSYGPAGVATPYYDRNNQLTRSQSAYHYPPHPNARGSSVSLASGGYGQPSPLLPLPIIYADHNGPTGHDESPRRTGATATTAVSDSMYTSRQGGNTSSNNNNNNTVTRGATTARNTNNGNDDNEENNRNRNKRSGCFACPTTTKAKVLLLFLLCFSLGLSATVAYFVGVYFRDNFNDDDGDKSVPPAPTPDGGSNIRSPSPTTGPTATPSPTPVPLDPEVKQLLSLLNISPSTYMMEEDDVSAPSLTVHERDAIQWMLTEDPLRSQYLSSSSSSSTAAARTNRAGGGDTHSKTTSTMQQVENGQDILEVVNTSILLEDVKERYAIVVLFYSTGGPTSWIDSYNFLSGTSICFWNKKLNSTDDGNNNDGGCIDNCISPTTITSTKVHETIVLGADETEEAAGRGSLKEQLQNAANEAFYSTSTTTTATLTQRGFDGPSGSGSNPINSDGTKIADGNGNDSSNVDQDDGSDGMVSSFSIRNGGIFCSTDYHLVTSGGSGSGIFQQENDDVPKVSRIILVDNGLQGTLPSRLATLTGLQMLELQRNELHGTLPIEWFTGLTTLNNNDDEADDEDTATVALFKELQTLNIEDNSFTGMIPSELGNNVHMATSLQILSIGENFFDGSIQSNLGNLQSLRVLDLHGNPNLIGSIPSELARLPSLVMFHIYDVEQISGSIPDFRSQPYLTQVIIGLSGISGSIPRSVWQLPALQSLLLSGNRLTGSMPANQLGKATSLRRLWVGNNLLTGTMPNNGGFSDTSIWRSFDESLTDLRLHNNFMVGTVPTELSFLTNLERFNIQNNFFDGEFPNQVAAIQSLNNFQIQENNLTGNLRETCQFGIFPYIMIADCSEPNPEILCPCCSECY